MKKLYVTGFALTVALLAQETSPNFTGKITRLDPTPAGVIAHIKFEAGSRTKWHSHGAGQIILVEEGVALAQERGKPVIELHAGDTIYCPPGVEHWHGASPKSASVQYNVTRGDIKWLELVSDKDYTAKPKKK